LGCKRQATGAMSACGAVSCTFTEVYNRESGILVHDESLETVKKMKAAVELEAPFANGVLSVTRIMKANNEMVESQWQNQIAILHEQASKPQFQPRWREEGDATENQDREYVNSQLMQGASEETPRVWSCRVFHGTPGEVEAKGICETGLNNTLAQTTGWFGEGCYSSKDAAYALRYCWKTEFWNIPGQTAFIVAGRACFSNVFPVTGEDDLRGKPIGAKAAKGATGCDAHFVLVKPVLPHGQEKRRTYQACSPHERHKGNELVIYDRFQFHPEYIMEVCVGNDADLLQRAKAAADDEDACTLQSMMEKEFRRFKIDEGEQSCAGHQQHGQTQNVGEHHQREVMREQQRSQHRNMPPQSLLPLQKRILDELGTSVLDTLQIAKACGETSKKDVNPTLHQMERQQLLTKTQEQGKRAHWRRNA